MFTRTTSNLIWNPADFGGINVTNFGYKESLAPDLIIINPSEKIDSFSK